MSVTARLFAPLLSAPAQPLVTHYDDALGSRIELSRATVANWAAKTANWLRDELDVEVGSPVSVNLPAHWQTVGVLSVLSAGASLVQCSNLDVAALPKRAESERTTVELLKP